MHGDDKVRRLCNQPTGEVTNNNCYVETSSVFTSLQGALYNDFAEGLHFY